MLALYRISFTSPAIMRNNHVNSMSDNLAKPYESYWTGCWISTHEKYRSGIADEVLECFDISLKTAEKACIKQIVLAEKLDEIDAQYLYAGLFAFVRHRLRYMTVGGYKEEE